MLEYKVTQINPSLYLIKDPLDVNLYLIVGNSKALLFDTGYGIGDIPATVKAITDKPLTVVLGHGHIDHANGAYQFDEVYLREPDNELYHEHTSADIRSVILQRLEEAGLEPGFDTEEWKNGGSCKLKPLEPGKVFDLGGLNVEVIDMAGHTGGSIGLLIIEQRILLDSDSANTHCWMFVPQSLSVREYIAMLERVIKLEFDEFYVAHQDYPHPKSDFDKFISVAKNATIEKSRPYDNWKELNPYIYTEDDVSIVINERTLSGE
jgi:glyoxylase-like metal-dependent hydrolase (beta-lactamase superfamily II)